MGTKAYLEITSNKEGTKVWSTIFWVHPDGSPHNLLWLAEKFIFFSTELSKNETNGADFSSFKFVEKVMARVLNEDPRWMRLITKRDLSGWEENRAVLNPFTGQYYCIGINLSNHKTVQRVKLKVPDPLDQVDPQGTYHTPWSKNTEFMTESDLMRKWANLIID